MSSSPSQGTTLLQTFNWEFCKRNLFVVLLLITLIIYFPFVWLNFIFTFFEDDPFGVPNVPFYTSDQLWPWTWFYGPQRFSFMWLIIASDVLLLLYLWFPFVVYFSESTYGRQRSFVRFIYVLIIIIGTLMQFFKTGYVLFGFITCSQVQLCRRFSVTGTDDSVDPNWVFWMFTVFQIIFSTELLFLYVLDARFYQSAVLVSAPPSSQPSATGVNTPQEQEEDSSTSFQFHMEDNYTTKVNPSSFSKQRNPFVMNEPSSTELRSVLRSRKDK